ncbi:MAG: ATP-binding protein [Gammaproteobacteria bacterium]
MSQTRSDPETLLKQIQYDEENDKKGKLKIYLGAAPGVGKTTEMLQDAALSREKNLDVLVGIVEAHGREEVTKLLNQFEVLPPLTIEHRNKEYNEFDLDAALKRAPGLILVDEMAHTNVPGLRHEKRWQDIKELLDRGIDVYTTLNVQHIESLKDDVAQIIQAPVKETIPDFMLELASIELVDLPPEDLLKRLQEGKIYFPAQASLAAENFFRKGNLIALRELALRVTANRVDSDVQSYRKASGIQAIWPTNDKILVCVGPNSQSLKLIRIAKQLANGLQAEWIAVYVDTPSVFLSKTKRNLAIKNLRLAEQLGAVTHILMGRDIVKELLKFARDSNVTQIMLSKDRSHSWRHFFRKRLADELIAQSGEMNVYIVGSNKSASSNQFLAEYPSIAWPYYGLSFLAVGLVSACGIFFSSIMTSSVVALCYLLVVTLIAVLGRPGPAILTSFLSVLAYDYFFVSPVYYLKVVSAHSLITLSMMFIVSLLMTYWMVLKYRETKIARQIQQQIRESYDFSQKLLKTRGLQEILTLGAQYIGQFLSSHILILLPKGPQLEVQATYPLYLNLNEKDRGVAQWVYDMAQPAGLGTDTLSSAEALYIPLHTPSQPAMGVLKIQPEEKILFSPDQLRALESFVNQLALALEVDHLQEKLRKKQVKREVDSARNALLKTLSTELNHPLKLILNVLGSGLTQKMNDASAGQEVVEELNKVNLINNNILQIIEFEAHRIQLDKKSVDLVDLVQHSVKQFCKTNHQRTIQIHSPDSVPKIMVDQLRIQEVLFNLLDNSIKYSPPEALIDIYVEEKDIHILVSVENSGSSIKEQDLVRIFNPFYRVAASQHKASLGLGLTLCQLNIEAHGGRIWAENLPQKNGVAFRFILPY